MKYFCLHHKVESTLWIKLFIGFERNMDNQRQYSVLTILCVPNENMSRFKK